MNTTTTARISGYRAIVQEERSAVANTATQKTTGNLVAIHRAAINRKCTGVIDSATSIWSRTIDACVVVSNNTITDYGCTH